VRSVLAIDPAWTVRQPSGVALLQEAGDGWSCARLAPSYSQFLALADGSSVDWSATPSGGEPVVGELLDSARRLLEGAPVDLVTIDMPVATISINGRRASDAAISQEFGGRGCSTHSPSVERPGPISDRLRASFAVCGYPLATSVTPPGTTPALVEVYPHPALLVLLGADYRVPYKLSRARRYWPELSPSERRGTTVETWRDIYTALSVTISGDALRLPPPDAIEGIGNTRLKRYEDALDALVCGWVGIQYVQGACHPFGDETSAIWTP
jgi:predicted RNase H-like nuclease